MHAEVKKYCESVKARFPAHFTGKAVLDCGSLDINGNNRYLFDQCSYTGIDIVPGKNVDVVTRVHLFNPDRTYDVVVSTEMLEHDALYRNSLNRMVMLLKPGGLLLITAAGSRRPEHGTTEHVPADSPLTHDYYCNLTVEMLVEPLCMDDFTWWEISYVDTDIRFAGIRR